MKTNTLLIAIAFAAISARVQAIPSGINYQGVLTDAQSQPVTGSKTMSMKLYDAATEGNLLYTEDLGSVSVAKGVFSFEFGVNGTSVGQPSSAGVTGALRAATDQLWAEVTVDGIVQSPRQKVLTAPFATIASATTDSDALVNLVLDLQNKVIQLQAGVTSGTSPSALISDTFSDQNGVNNLVDVNSTEAAYVTPVYNAGLVVKDSSTYSTAVNFASFQLAKTYTSVSALVVHTTVEQYFDTECYIIYNYEDGSSAQTSTASQTQPEWKTFTYSNPQLAKRVASLEVWTRKPTSVVGNIAKVQNIQILKYQDVEVVVNLSSFGRTITAAQLQVDGVRQTGDSITYKLSNASAVSATLQLGVKSELTTPISQPAKLRIILSPPPIQNFTYGATSVRAFALRLW